jgi:hypothetical protein
MRDVVANLFRLGKARQELRYFVVETRRRPTDERPTIIAPTGAYNDLTGLDIKLDVTLALLLNESSVRREPRREEIFRETENLGGCDFGPDFLYEHRASGGNGRQTSKTAESCKKKAL